MHKIAFAVVGNCQARPLANIIRLCKPDWDCVEVTVVHLSKPGNAETDLEKLARADVIFAQSVGNSYFNAHLATENLREQLRADLFEWPNLFFHGQNPDCFYLSGESGRIKSPLDEYHIKSIFDDWHGGHSVQEAVRNYTVDGLFDEETVERRVEASFRNLKMREEKADISVADVVAERWRDEPLFHVFNHPTSRILIECAERLLEIAGQKASEMPSPGALGEPLGRFVPPLSPALARLLGLRFLTSTFSMGIEVNWSDKESFRLGKPRSYDLGEFVETSFRIYEFHRDELIDPSLTPRLAS